MIKKLLCLLVLLLTATTGAWAQAQTYKVTLQEGTEDASNWQGKAGEGEFQALPLEGVAEGATVTVTYSGEKKVKSVKAVKKEVIKPDLLSGVFSVSASKKVNFSKGNLQYDGTSWKFATNQYDVLGANSTGANGTATGYPMDLFTWGNTSNSTAWNGSSYYTENANLSGDTDWGSRMGSGWYTLSKDEWLYLFGMEENNTDKIGHARYCKYFRATVNSVKGIVVLPDDLSGISDIPVESSRGTASAFNGKTYTTDAWSALESAGCVFLPAAGRRDYGTSMYNVGLYGFYWSSTAYDAYTAYRVYFNSGDVKPAHDYTRDNGFSVRLVQEVAPNP